MKPGRFNQCGFTLLELVISMGLTVLLLSTLTGGMYSVARDWQKQTSVLDEILDKALTILQIERALLAAFPHSYSDLDTLENYVYFDGSDNSLSWVSKVSPQRQSGLTAWRLESDNDTGLTLSLTPAYSDNPAERLDEATPTLLLANYSAEFYYLMQVNEDEKEWLDEWLGEELQSLPLAVYIILTPINPERDQVLEIVAPIKAFNHQNIQANLPVF